MSHVVFPYKLSFPYILCLMPTDTATIGTGRPARKKVTSCTSPYLHTLPNFTPSKWEEVVPLVRSSSKHPYHQQVEHDALSQHPAKHTQEQVVEECCHHRTQPLIATDKWEQASMVLWSSGMAWCTSTNALHETYTLIRCSLNSSNKSHHCQ